MPISPEHEGAWEDDPAVISSAERSSLLPEEARGAEAGEYPNLLPDEACPPEMLINVVLEAFPNVTREQLMGRGRTAEVAMVRQILMYFLRNPGMQSYPAIGRLIGRDHSTVIYGCNTLERRVRAKDPMTVMFMEEAKAKLDEFLGRTDE